MGEVSYVTKLIVTGLNGTQLGGICFNKGDKLLVLNVHWKCM